MALFSPLPPKPKPSVVKTLSTASFSWLRIIVLDLIDHGLRAGRVGAVGQLDLGHQHALVLLAAGTISAAAV